MIYQLFCNYADKYILMQDESTYCLSLSYFKDKEKYWIWLNIFLDKSFMKITFSFLHIKEVKPFLRTVGMPSMCDNT